MKENNFQLLKEVLHLLSEYNKIEEKLRDRNIIRTKNILSEIGEWYVSILFDFERTEPNEKGFDCLNPKNGKRIQVKTTRREEKCRLSFRLPKKNIDEQRFDELIILKLGDNFRIRQVFKLDRDDISGKNFSLSNSKKKGERYDLTWNSLKRGNFEITQENALQKELKDIEVFKMLME